MSEFDQFLEDCAKRKVEKKYRAKLTESDVRRIKELRREGLKLKEIASMYDVSMCLVSSIMAKKRWAHVK